MTPGRISEKVLTGRAAWIRDMLAQIRSLPLEDYTTFSSDRRNAAAAESCLRRALEALLDLGRHILAKGLAIAATEYAEVPQRLVDAGILTDRDAETMMRMARYRNRMVHFYDEIAPRELYGICSERLGDVEVLLEALLSWVGSHSEMVDPSL